MELLPCEILDHIIMQLWKPTDIVNLTSTCNHIYNNVSMYVRNYINIWKQTRNVNKSIKTIKHFIADLHVGKSMNYTLEVSIRIDVKFTSYKFICANPLLTSCPNIRHMYGAARSFSVITNEYCTSIDEDNKFSLSYTYNNINYGIVFEPEFDKIRDKIISLVEERNIDMSNIWHSTMIIGYDPSIGY